MNPSRNFMAYASAARGVKSGGFNNTTSTLAAAQAYAPETNWTYELGLKASTANGQFSVNADVFYIDWNNLQIQTFVGSTTTSVITNVTGGATVKGLELAATMRPTSWFNATISYAYADPTFKSGTYTSGITARDCGVTSGATLHHRSRSRVQCRRAAACAHLASHGQCLVDRNVPAGRAMERLRPPGPELPVRASSSTIWMSTTCRVGS